jgi:proteasome lid subunit RPN8/RPN11
MRRIVVRAADWRRMLALVEASAPLEACGLLAGSGERVSRVIPVENVERSRTRFRMEPRAQVQRLIEIERDGLELLGIYHSHPSGPSGPSPTDRAEAAYPGAAWLIWTPEEGGWSCRAFSLDGTEPTEIEIIVPEEGQRRP